jgi:hypothetical protein
MALLMALALVGTAGAAGDASGESAGDITQSSQATSSQSSDDYASSGKTSTATETTYPRTGACGCSSPPLGSPSLAWPC